MIKAVSKIVHEKYTARMAFELYKDING